MNHSDSPTPTTWPPRPGALARVQALAFAAFLGVILAADGQLFPSTVARAQPKADFAAVPGGGNLPDPQTHHVVSFINIGWSADKPATRNVGRGMSRWGWKGMIDHYVRPQLKWGIRRIEIHNPFGTMAGQPMQFDQFVDARKAGLKFLTEGFVKAWKPVIQGKYTDGEPVEVIAYLGKLRSDPDFKALAKQGEKARWLARALKSVALPLQAGMSIGLDSASGAGKDSMTYHFAQMLRGMNVRVYIETRPRASHAHWFNYPIISKNHHWKRSDPDKYGDAGAGDMASNDQLKREIIRILFPPHDADRATYQIRHARKIIAEGNTVAIRLNSRIMKQVTLKELENSHGNKADYD